MKTVEEAAKEYVRKKRGFATEFELKHDSEIFKSGVEFAQRWIPVEEELPPLSQKVLCKDSTVFDVYLFESNTDRDIKIEVCEVTHWRPIEIK